MLFPKDDDVSKNFEQVSFRSVGELYNNGLLDRKTVGSGLVETVGSGLAM